MTPLTIKDPLESKRADMFNQMAEYIEKLLRDGGEDLKACLRARGIAVIELPTSPKELHWLYANDPIIFALVNQAVDYRLQEKERA